MPEPTSGLQMQGGPISDQQIRERAYDIWERHHSPEGFEMQFWFMAKRELMAERKGKMTHSAASEKESNEVAS